MVRVPAVASMSGALSKAEADLSRLKEWQEVVKRMADDKVQEAAQELQACRAEAAEKQASLSGGKYLQCIVASLHQHNKCRENS